MTFKEYVCPESLEEAWELNQKKNNRIVAGNMWLRLGKGSCNKLIDLSGLNLDKIEDLGTEIKIGAMVSLRELEENNLLNGLTGDIFKNSLKYIVGTQFRNAATVGGSVYSRFGFSDAGNLLMAVDAEVELYKAGRMGLADFYASSRNEDILTAVYVKKKPVNIRYFVKRNTATGLPLLNVSVASDEVGIRVCVGARPGRAKCICFDGITADRLQLAGECDREATAGEKSSESEAGKECAGERETITEQMVKTCMDSLCFGSNSYASAAYRKQLAKVFIRRGLGELSGAGLIT